MTLCQRPPPLDINVDFSTNLSRLLICLRSLRSNLNDLEYIVSEMVDSVDPPSPVV